MKTLLKLLVFLLAALIVSSMDSHAQTSLPALPVYVSITPNFALQNTPTTVTIKAKNLRAGTVLIINSQIQPTKIINQTTATATIQGVILKTVQQNRFYLMDKYNRIDLGEHYFFICEPLVIDSWQVLPPSANGDLNYTLVNKSGCSY